MITLGMNRIAPTVCLWVPVLFKFATSYSTHHQDYFPGYFIQIYSIERFLQHFESYTQNGRKILPYIGYQ